MKKAIYSFSLLFALNYWCSAQNLSPEWAASTGGNASESGDCISSDAAGNVFVAGSFNSTFLVVNGDTLFNKGTSSTDIFLTKYSSAGKVIWSKGLGSLEDDHVSAVTCDNAGNVIITGTFTGKKFDANGISITNSGFVNAYVAKFDPEGNAVWALSCGGAYFDVGVAVQCDEDGSTYLLGDFQSKTIVLGTEFLVNAEGLTSDIFILKISGDGHVIWAERTGGLGNDMGYGLALAPNGDVLITGEYRSPALLMGKESVLNEGIGNAFVACFSHDGKPSWIKSLGGNSSDKGKYITTDDEGNIIVAGTFRSTDLDMGTTVLENSLSNKTCCDLFIVKLDGKGETQWTQQVKGIGNKTLNGMALQNDGNLIINGSFPGDRISIGATVLTNYARDYCNFISEIDKDGKELWIKRLNTSNVVVSGFCTDFTGNLYLTGQFAEFQINIGNIKLVNANKYYPSPDALLFKLSENPLGMNNSLNIPAN